MSCELNFLITRMYCAFLFCIIQVTYTPLHHQSAWTTESVAPPAGLVNYGGSLPHLRPGVAANTQTLTTSSAAPVPRPPATVRSRALSAGARNRQYRDRAPDTNVPSVRYGKEQFAPFDVGIMIVLQVSKEVNITLKCTQRLVKS